MTHHFPHGCDDAPGAWASVPDRSGLASSPLVTASLVKAVGLDLRRAVLAVLLRAQEPLRIAEIVRCLRDVEQVDVDWIAARARHFAPLDPSRTQPTAAKVIADLLRHQVAYGRAVRVRRGEYAINRSGLSRSTAHRCLNWQRIRAGQVRGR